jgi:tripartite-type tricarboxylate transporter receptor subunit TctC
MGFHTFRTAVVAAFAGGLAALAFTPAAAQQSGAPYPTRPVRLVVPFPAGGFSDVVVRVMTPRLSERLGQPAVVDNRPGASGNIGADIVAKAPPDGYVLLVNSGNFATNAALSTKLPFDSIRDFAPVTLLAETPLVIVVHPSLPVKSVKELVALARTRPGELNYASSGVGTTGHLAAELLKSMARVNMVHIAYKGGIPNMTAVLSGEASVTFPNLPAAVPHLRNGRLRALAVTSARRSQSLKELPTVAESGFPGYDLAGWLGVAAPAGTPSEIIKRLHSDFVAVLNLPDTRTKFIEQGADPVGNTPQEFGAYVESQIARLKKIGATAGVKAE